MKIWLAILISVFVAVSVNGQALPTPVQRGDTGPFSHAPDDVAYQMIEYGEESGQRLYFYRANGERPAPLIIYLSGYSWGGGQGGLADPYLIPFAHERGYSFVDLYTRNIGEQRIEDVLHDVTVALAELDDRAGELHFDPRRLVLAARGSSANVVALLATNAEYFAAAGLEFDSIRGVVLINGDGFDLHQRARQNDRLRRLYYPDFFGAETDWSRYSPVEQLHTPNAPAFFLLAEERRGSLVGFAQDFSRSLTSAGVSSEMHTLSRFQSVGSDERRRSDAANPTTALEAFLARILSSRE